jgi:hypothetical protein
VHQLYVKVVTGSDPDRSSRAITLQTLRYVHDRVKLFLEMGVAIKVNRIRSQDLASPELVAAMKRRGITRLPALTTLNNVYLGLKEIYDLYEKNIREYMAVGRRGEKPVVESAGEVPEDGLASYYNDEMTFERAEEDAQETGMGEVDDMMDAHRRFMERREASTSSRRPGKGAQAPARREPPPARRGGRSGPPAPSRGPTTRADNIGSGGPVRRPPARDAPLDPDDAEFQATIDRLSQGIDSTMQDEAFASGGGDSLDDDGGADVQDDLMERAYFTNMSATDM